MTMSQRNSSPGQLVPQRVADEVHPLRERVVLHRQAQLLREQVGDAILESFAFAVRERQIAGIDARPKRGTRLLGAAAPLPAAAATISTARVCAEPRDTMLARSLARYETLRAPHAVTGHCFSSSTFARVMAPSDRPFR